MHKLLIFYLLFLPVSTIVKGQGVNHIFALDNSGSMKKHWAKTQSQLSSFIWSNSVKNGDIVYIYTFNEELSEEYKYQVNSEIDKANILQYVAAIETQDKKNTCLYKSVYELLDKIAIKKINNQYFYVLTDKESDCRSNIELEKEIRKKISELKRKDGFTNLYYIVPKPNELHEFPELIFPKDTSVIIDFSKKNGYDLRIPVRINHRIKRITDSLFINSSYIKLESNYVQVFQDSLYIKLVLGKDYIPNAKETGFIVFYATDVLENINRYSLNALFIMPPKRKVKIAIH